VSQRFTPCGFAKPNRPEPEVFQFRSYFLGLGGRTVL
jgi:hypothetical protein